LQIEIQIRTQLQHAWATAVEAVGTFTRQALKWRGGDADWRRFFELMGSAIAYTEGAPLADNVPQTKEELASEIRRLSAMLHVKNTLRTYDVTLQYIGDLKRSEAKLLLVHMKPNEPSVVVEGFRQREAVEANQRYKYIEAGIPTGAPEQVVLVQVDSLNSLKKAYPNYFLDTQRFSDILGDVLDWR
jgi:hypothetical protein